MPTITQDWKLPERSFSDKVFIFSLQKTDSFLGLLASEIPDVK